MLNLKCPKCENKIPWYRVSKAFICPACHSTLNANVNKAILYSIVIWIFVDIPIYLSIHNIILRTIASACAGIVIVAFALSTLKLKESDRIDK